VTPHWEGEEEDARAAHRAAEEKAALDAGRTGAPITLGNEFSEIRVSRVETRNGSRLLIESTRSGQWVALCPLELEALTWQNTATFSAMIGHPFGPLLEEEA
jgi:8-oxo-dGTP pyrophosphatase MutT (NUDIX family)